MSSKNNVNPGQYKTRGSLRQGEEVIHDLQKKTFTKAPDNEVENLVPGPQPAASVAKKVKVAPKQAKRSQSGR